MPREEYRISGPVPLCHSKHCKFLMPSALLYKAQTAAGFSTLLPWNWINTMPVRVFTVISQPPEGLALTGHRPPVSFCSLLCGTLAGMVLAWHNPYRTAYLRKVCHVMMCSAKKKAEGQTHSR